MEEKFITNENDVGKRLDVFLSEKTNLTRSQIKILIDEKKAFLNGKNKKAGEKIKNHDEILVDIEYKKPISLIAQDIPLDIVYEDENLAVINKQQGLVVHPAVGNHDKTLVNALLFHFKNLSFSNDFRPGIVHRLDKNTSGLMLVAKNDKTHSFLAKQIKDKIVSRHYMALVVGHFKNDIGEICTGIGRDKKNRKKMAVYPLGEQKTAITQYKVIRKFENYSLVEFVLKTGRTHQIRVHSAYLNHAIVGDDVYGKSTKLYNKGQLLHAYKIEFFPQKDAEKLIISVPLPVYFEKVIASLM